MKTVAIIFEDESTHKRSAIVEDKKGDKFIEYAHLTEGTFKLYQVPIPFNVLGALKWVDPLKMSGVLDTTLAGVERLSVHQDINARAMFILSIGDYYGWASLDNEPLTISKRELDLRWKAAK